MPLISLTERFRFDATFTSLWRIHFSLDTCLFFPNLLFVIQRWCLNQNCLRTRSSIVASFYGNFERSEFSFHKFLCSLTKWNVWRIQVNVWRFFVKILHVRFLFFLNVRWFERETVKFVVTIGRARAPFRIVKRVGPGEREELKNPLEDRRYRWFHLEDVWSDILERRLIKWYTHTIYQTDFWSTISGNNGTRRSPPPFCLTSKWKKEHSVARAPGNEYNQNDLVGK